VIFRAPFPHSLLPDFDISTNENKFCYNIFLINAGLLIAYSSMEAITLV
jgi:hypothetical protein